ncbi:MAG: hypothetical protein JWQ20_1223 [Conexibacter sp.]|nr:hypothetical protein [Conexibacter sp.]
MPGPLPLPDDLPTTLLRAGDTALRIATPVARALGDLVGPGEVVRLIPPARLADGLRDGTLQYLTTKAGADKAIIVNAKTRDFAGHGDIVRSSQAAVAGAIAWQAMAVVTQQYYLHEINDKLETVTLGVADLRARLQNAQAGELLAMAASLEDLRSRREAGLDPAPEDRTMLRHWMHEADALRATALLNLEKGIEEAPGADRRHKFILKTLKAMEGGPVADFAVAAMASQILLAARAELLSLAADDRELEHLLQDNERATQRVVAELEAGASLFDDVLRRALEHHDTPDFGDKVAESLQRENVRVWMGPGGIPISKGALAIKEWDDRRRDEAIDRFRESAAAPLEIAAADLTQPEPKALLVSRSEDDGGLHLELEA